VHATAANKRESIEDLQRSLAAEGTAGPSIDFLVKTTDSRCSSRFSFNCCLQRRSMQFAPARRSLGADVLEITVGVHPSSPPTLSSPLSLAFHFLFPFPIPSLPFP